MTHGARSRVSSPHELKPGEYGLFKDGWHARTPNGHVAWLRGHDVTEHEDGSITVSPSIGVTSSKMNPATGKMTPYQVYHGYITDGVWRDA